MKLADIAGGAGAVPIEALPGDQALAREVQGRLILAGVLDPPIDGAFGSASEWALSEFCKAKPVHFDGVLTAEAAQALLSPDIGTVFPMSPGTGLVGKVVSAMQRRGYWLSRHPACFNIVYVEGANSDGSPNANTPNQFNDLRMLIQVDQGVCKLTNIWEGTTEPGRYWTEHPMDSHGAARIKFGQYKSWRVGTHHPGKPSGHEALVQVENIVVYRDKHKTFRREGPTFTGIFAINQHWGYDAPKNDLGKTSAGCLVGRAKDGHKQFMAAVKSDPRYLANHGYRFVTAVMPGSALDEAHFNPTTDH